MTRERTKLPAPPIPLSGYTPWGITKWDVMAAVIPAGLTMAVIIAAMIAACFGWTP